MKKQKLFAGLGLGDSKVELLVLYVLTATAAIVLMDLHWLVALSVAPGVMYLMAWASGFKENRIFDLVDRVMKRLFSGGESSEEDSPEELLG